MRLAAFTLLVVMAWHGAALAGQRIEGEELAQGSALCLAGAAKAEAHYHIPEHLLVAIAMVETGIEDREDHLKHPWPWTLMSRGRGYHLHSQQEAVAQARKLYAKSHNDIFTGCMQVSLTFHPEIAYPTLQVKHSGAAPDFVAALNPDYNTAYAAFMLREHYQRSHSWRRAVADYHSRAPGASGDYAARVYAQWNKIKKTTGSTPQTP